MNLTCSEPQFQLVGGESRCAGELEVKHLGEWRAVEGYLSPWTPKTAGVACRELDCGSAVSVAMRYVSSYRPVWMISPDCAQSGSALRECARSFSSPFIITLTCSDSVRLLGGTSLCSGRLEVNSDPSNPSWSSVCEADFDQQDAQVVCRQLGCGAPSVLQGALYGEGEAPMGTKEFQCGGHESALLDCSSASERNTCSPGTAVSLTCSEPDEVRLVGGESRCAGDLEVKHQGGEWRPVGGLYSLWTLKAAGVLCRDLDCGSAVSVEERESSWRSVWRISSACVQSGSALRECAGSASSSSTVNLTCSEPDEVRLVGGESRCAGDLELKHQGEWRPVGGYYSLWTLKTAGVACRELDCGSAVSVGQRIESPGRSVWGISFDCVQSGSALRECAGSGSSDDILNLTCSELFWLFL
ncbi:scavenger receptor cysteine-rich type 1 protein M130-like isoform X2 [Trematomus bernacchii]|uniref:scavenger receptor cysteine-rich type 1 protein M130-like isoform X2 n=1 Tax=Trematomus bernacchii TaxID=40690 RepID=UPI00146C30EC|nr:scavenger receptor cysteine-rich type 1 protein M130-like isoform X2 [Trematomus bernacchii]